MNHVHNNFLEYTIIIGITRSKLISPRRSHKADKAMLVPHFGRKLEHLFVRILDSPTHPHSHRNPEVLHAAVNERAQIITHLLAKSEAAPDQASLSLVDTGRTYKRGSAEEANKQNSRCTHGEVILRIYISVATRPIGLSDSSSGRQ